MVSKLDKQTFTREFESHWVPRSFDLVLHEAKSFVNYYNHKYKSITLRVSNLIPYLHTVRKRRRIKNFILKNLHINKKKLHNEKERTRKYIYIYIYIYIRESLNKFPEFFRMGTFINSTHMKLKPPSK